MDIVQSEDITALSKITPNIFPMAWGDENAELSEDDTKDLEKLMSMSTSVINFLWIGLGIVFGIVLIIAGSVICNLTIRQVQKSEKEHVMQPLKNQF